MNQTPTIQSLLPNNVGLMNQTPTIQSLLPNNVGLMNQTPTKNINSPNFFIQTGEIGDVPQGAILFDHEFFLRYK